MNQNLAQNQERKEDESKFSSKSDKKKTNQNSAQNQKRKEDEPKLSSKSEKKRK